MVLDTNNYIIIYDKFYEPSKYSVDKVSITSMVCSIDSRYLLVADSNGDLKQYKIDYQKHCYCRPTQNPQNLQRNKPCLKQTAFTKSPEMNSSKRIRRLSSNGMDSSHIERHDSYSPGIASIKSANKKTKIAFNEPIKGDDEASFKKFDKDENVDKMNNRIGNFSLNLLPILSNNDNLSFSLLDSKEKE